MTCEVSTLLNTVILMAIAGLTSTAIVMIKLLRKWLAAVGNIAENGTGSGANDDKVH